MSKHDHENENMPREQEPIGQELHERLCAYVFGELQGAERADFEAELLRSPALQRERERLTATIGLVKAAVPDEGLSTAVRRDLVAAARRSRFRFLRGRTLVRVAAAAVLILGSAFAVRMLTGRAYPVTEDVKVASAPKAAREELEGHEPTAELREVAEAKLAERGETREDAGAEKRRAEQQKAIDDARIAQLSRDTAFAREADRMKSLRGLGYVGDDGPSAAPSAEAPPAPEVAEELKAMGYGGGGRAPGDGNSPGLDALGIDVGTRLAPSLALQDSSISLAKTEGGKAAETIGATSVGVGTVGHYATGTPSAFASRSAGAGGPRGNATMWAELKGLPPPATAGTYLQAYTSAEQLKWRLNSTGIAAPSATAGPAAAVQLAAVPHSDELDDLGYGGDDESAEERRKSEGSVQSRRVPMLTREQVTVQVEHLLGSTRVAPDESASDMFFRYWGDSPFLPADEQPSSTFAVDVDTASYALARSYLNRGQLPPREAVRTEEFVNYFKADQAPPTDGKPFAIGMELAPSLFAKDARTEMLRISVRGKDVQDFQRQPIALTVVIDNSGSMAEGGRLELVKRSLALLLRQLDNSDAVAVVKFSNDAAVVAPMLPAARRGELENLILPLATEGGTNVEAGLRKGYELALQNLAGNAVNRVVLCSDGVGNIGETSAKGLLELVKEAHAKGIYLNTVGVGMGNHNDAFLEELADKGDGVCNYVDSDAEAKRVFVDGLASLVQPIARDVKIQVEFDRSQVESWRLLGYENRALRAQDFRNDKVDGGEVNAGHQVTALYELVRRPSQSGPLATVHLRYKPPFAIDQGKEGERARAEAEQGLEEVRTLQAAAVLPGFAAASNGYQRAALVAQFAEVLRQSVHARGESFADLLREARRLEKALGDPDFTEFVTLLEKANPLLDARSKQETPRVQQSLDELSKLHYEQALRGRKRELAAQAGEPAPSADEMRDAERVEQEASKAIERLENEVRDELLRANGIEPLSPDDLRGLQGLGYAGDKEK